MMISTYDGKRAYNSRYIRSIQLRRGGGGAEMEIVADIDGVRGYVILYQVNIFEYPDGEGEDAIRNIYERLIDRLNGDEKNA